LFFIDYAIFNIGLFFCLSFIIQVVSKQEAF
jgi:hypothetical protein